MFNRLVRSTSGRGPRNPPRPSQAGVITLIALLVSAGVSGCETGGDEAAATGSTHPATSTTPHTDDSDPDPGEAGSDPGLGAFHRQDPDWEACSLGAGDSVGLALDEAGARCAEIQVPLDYDDPGGRRVTLAFSMLPATDTEHRLGTLVINNGGPGLPALGSPPEVREAMGDTGQRFDLVGLDPRFVGRSTPLDCGWPVGAAITSAGTTRESFDAQVELQRDLADRCAATNGDVLGHITTRNTARDLDVVREVLGEERISYLGYSYGTYLGTVYTQMFPDRVDRMVLDGAVAPDDYHPQLLKGLDAVNEAALADWAEWAAARHDTYHLGTTGSEVLDRVVRLIDDAARSPLTVGPVDLDDTRIPLLLFQALSDDSDASRASLADTVALLAEASEGVEIQPPDGLTALLTVVFTDADTNLGTAQAAIGCGDMAASTDPESYWADIEAGRAEHPVFGPLADNITLCAFWDPPLEQPTEITSDAELLIVAATGDPRTTYASSLDLHRQLPGSRLLTLADTTSHGIYGHYGNRCINDTVNTYLATGELPSNDPTCTP